MSMDKSTSHMLLDARILDVLVKDVWTRKVVFDLFVVLSQSLKYTEICLLLSNGGFRYIFIM